jgi:hypothetical protein
MGSNHRNRSGHSLPQILRWPTERAQRWTCEFLHSAIDNDTFLAVIAIGSAVRPNVVSADLDLVVISAEPTPPYISHPMEIDLRVYSAASIDDQIASGHDLLGWAIKFGKSLFQRDTDAVHEQAVSYLTHLARAELLDQGIYPASRPELAAQLRAHNGSQIAEQLDRLLQDDGIDEARIEEVLKLTA